MAESSFMQIDNLISENVKVGMLLSNLPATTPSASIDLTQATGDLGFLFPCSYLNMGLGSTTSQDGSVKTFTDLKTKETGVRFVFDDMNSKTKYSILTSSSTGLVEHSTSLSGHDFTSAMSDKRLRIGGNTSANATGVLLTALDGLGMPTDIIFGAANVRIPTASFSVGTKLSVDPVKGVLIGDDATPVTISGPLIINASGAFTVSSACGTNVIMIDPQTSTVAINGAPEAGKDLKVVGNVWVSNSITVCGALSVAGAAQFQSTLSAPSISSTAFSTGSMTVSCNLNASSANLGTLSATSIGASSASIVDLNATSVNVGNLFALGAATFAGAFSAGGISTVNGLSVSGTCSIGDPSPDPSKALNINGSAAMSGELFVGGAVTANSIVIGSTVTVPSTTPSSSLSVSGSAAVTGDLVIGGNIITHSIGTPGDNLSLNANILYFNTNQIMFKGDSYVVNTATTTFMDKVIRLGDTNNPKYNNALRDGSGIELVGLPDNKPAALNGDMSFTYHSCGGVWNTAGNLVSADQRSRWEVAGGNLSMKSADEKNSFMFSIDAGVLNLYKCALDANGTQSSSQLVASFGRNAI